MRHASTPTAHSDGAGVAWLGFVALAITGATLLLALPELVAVARGGLLLAATLPF